VQNAHGDLVTGERTEFIDLGGHRGVKSLAMHLPRLLWGGLFGSLMCCFCDSLAIYR
jgi:hypothetical protein